MENNALQVDYSNWEAGKQYPEWMDEISLATILLLAICYDGLPLVEASLGMAFFMLCAQIAHIKVKNPLIKYVPSFIFLVLSLFIAAFNYGVI